MESRLEAYRAQKKKSLEEQQKRAKYWDLFTFATLRRRVFGENQPSKADCQVNIPVLNQYCSNKEFVLTLSKYIP